jgi:hypothetical protein
MTKTKLVGGIVAVLMMISGSSAVAATNEQVYAKSNAPIATEALAKPVVNDKALAKPTTICKNHLVKELKAAGFKGRGLKIAWSIAMRESGGAATHISSTGDYGVFQFNRAAWSSQPWWNTQKLLTSKYNIMIAYSISQHGRTFYPWDIGGRGQYEGGYTPKSIYFKFKSWYKKFPSNCK